MNKRSRIFTAVLMTMILALTFILSGCGNKLTAKDVAGTYTCSMDVKKYINDGMKEGFAESSGMENVDFSFEQPINADFVLTLNEDETFDLKIDTDTFAEAFNSAIDAEGETFIKAILAAMGVSEDLVSDDQIQELLTQMKDEMAGTFEDGEMVEDAQTSGKFTLSGDSITLDNDESKQEGKIDGDTITFEGSILDDLGGGNWVFKKN